MDGEQITWYIRWWFLARAFVFDTLPHHWPRPRLPCPPRPVQPLNNYVVCLCSFLICKKTSLREHSHGQQTKDVPGHHHRREEDWAHRDRGRPIYTSLALCSLDPRYTISQNPSLPLSTSTRRDYSCAQTSYPRQQVCGVYLERVI